MRELDLPEVLDRAEDVSDVKQTPGWNLVADAIETHRQKTLQRLLNESTKPEDIPYLRGLAAGLSSMAETAESIEAYAKAREAEARKSLQEIA